MTLKDPQYISYCHWGRAWAAFAAARLAEAQREAESAAQATGYFVPISLPIGARAALWAGDKAGAAAIVVQIEAAVIRGQAFGLDLVTLRAGISALEGRRADAVAGYREALRGWRGLGLAFDEALAVVDLAIVLVPTESEMAEAASVIESAREILAGLGALPFLARLDAAAVTTDAMPPAASGSATEAAQAADAGQTAATGTSGYRPVNA